MRYGALVPALAFATALVAPSLAEADHHRSSDRGRSGYERSGRGNGRYDSRSSHRRSHDRGYRGSHREGYRNGYPHGHYRYDRRGYRYGYPPPRYYNNYYYGPRYRYRPGPPVYYAPRPVPYGYPGPVWGPPLRRGGVHGSVSLGLPFFGFSVYF